MRGLRNRTRRGAVLILCTILMASVATILLSTADLGMAAVRMQQAGEDSTRLQYTTDSVAAIATQMMIDKSLILPSTTNLTINGSSVSFDAKALTGARSRMVSLMTTVSNQRITKTEELIIGARGPVSPFWFAFGCFGSFSLAAAMTCDSDIYLNGDVSGTGSLATTARVYSAPSMQTLVPTASQGVVYNAPTYAPVADASLYKVAADTTVDVAVILPVAPLTFLSLGSYQSLWFRDGDFTFNNTYVGLGTCYINGNVSIRRLSAVTSADKVIVIVNGNVSIDTNNFDGFLFCSGNVTYTGSAGLRVNGAIHCANFDSGGKRVDITFDPFFWADPQWDKRMRVPGMW